MNNKGTTRLLLTLIPYFREVVIMSFSCDYCNTQNNEIQAAGTIQPMGSCYELRLVSLADFNRQVVKSDSATVKFIELDLEISQVVAS
jgi:zinc finger protein